MSILTTALPALLPALGDGLRAVFNRVTGGAGAMPKNVDEGIRLMDAEIRKMEALAKLDAPAGEIYKWAATARALQRPAIATLILIMYALALVSQPDAAVTLTLADLAGMVIFYLFGDRTYNFVKGVRR